MKKYISILFFLSIIISGCGPGYDVVGRDVITYDQFRAVAISKGWNITAKAEHIGSGYNSAHDGWGAHTSLERAKWIAMDSCESYGGSCVITMINTNVVYVLEKNRKTEAQTSQTQTTQTQTQTTQTQPTEPEKTESSGEEESLEETLNNVFGDRKLDRIEGLWGYQREGEKKARIYIIIKSEKYLYEEIVVFHPVERFKDEVSTRIIKKINNNSYKVKGTWLNKNKKEWQRDGKITFMNKFKIRFEYKETCHTDDDCFEHHVYYKEKIWPPETYTDELGLDEEQTEKLKNLIE